MKLIIVSVTILGLVGMMVVVGASAATEAGVSATVTVQNISVSVSDGGVVYGTLATGTSEDTTLSGVDDTQIATNNGNITENFNIKGDDSTTSWTLAGTAGNEQYVNKFCKVDTGDCDGTPAWTALTTSYQTLKTGVAKDGTYDFDLQITTPTATADFDEQTITVVVQATTAS